MAFEVGVRKMKVFDADTHIMSMGFSFGFLVAIITAPYSRSFAISFFLSESQSEPTTSSGFTTIALAVSTNAEAF